MFERKKATTPSTLRDVQEERNPTDVSDERIQPRMQSITNNHRTEHYMENSIVPLTEDQGTRDEVPPGVRTAPVEENRMQNETLPTLNTKMNKESKGNLKSQSTALSQDATDALLEENKQLLARKEELQALVQMLSQANVSEKGQFFMDAFSCQVQLEALAEDIDYLKNKSEYLRAQLFELHLERVEDMQLQDEKRNGQKAG
jgi:hypothetical protein